MTHLQLAQAFAEGRERNRRGGALRGFNMFIEGKTIFSYGYHFPIARRTGKFLEDGREIVFFNSRHYSVSTSKHQSYVSRFLNGGYYIIEIFNAEEPAKGLDELLSRANESEVKAQRARLDYMIESHKTNARLFREQARVLREKFLREEAK